MEIKPYRSGTIALSNEALKAPMRHIVQQHDENGFIKVDITDAYNAHDVAAIRELLAQGGITAENANKVIANIVADLGRKVAQKRKGG